MKVSNKAVRNEAEQEIVKKRKVKGLEIVIQPYERTEVIEAPDPATVAQAVAAIADAKQAQDIAILEIHPISPIADYFVIATGPNTRLTQAVIDDVERWAKSHGVAFRLEGEPSDQWVLIDLGPIVVHLFSPSAREFYGLERLWNDAKRISASGAAIPATRI
jgi:ribosome-associated protein